MASSLYIVHHVSTAHWRIWNKSIGRNAALATLIRMWSKKGRRVRVGTVIGRFRFKTSVFHMSIVALGVTSLTFNFSNTKAAAAPRLKSANADFRHQISEMHTAFGKV